jgi:hypothetical protein
MEFEEDVTSDGEQQVTEGSKPGVRPLDHPLLCKGDQHLLGHVLRVLR